MPAGIRQRVFFAATPMLPSTKRDEQHGIDYFNCGAWIDARPTYITVGEHGVQIHEYVERPEDSHPAAEQTPVDAEAAEIEAAEDDAGLLEVHELDYGEYEGVAT